MALTRPPGHLLPLGGVPAQAPRLYPTALTAEARGGPRVVDPSLTAVSDRSAIDPARTTAGDR